MIEFTKHVFEEALGRSLGTALAWTLVPVGAALSAFFWWGARRIGMLRRMRRAQIKNFYASRSEYRTARKQKTASDYVQITERKFVYVGLYLAQGTDESRMDDALRLLLRRKCEVQIVLLDAGISDEMVQQIEQTTAIAEGTLRGRLEHALLHLRTFRENLSSDERERFFLKRHKKAISATAFLIDWSEKKGRLLIDTKIPFVGRENAFGIEFEGVPAEGSLASAWTTSFERIISTAVNDVS